MSISVAAMANLAGRDVPEIIAFGSTPPYTNPSLTANLVLRVMLAIVSNVVCLIPLRLLYRNGEFAVTVFILNLEIANLSTIVNALIWRDNNLENWWPGYGFCDAIPYLRNFTQALYGTCMLAIMRNLAQQVSLLRAHPLSVNEKRRRNLIHALIIFPVPVLQMALTWPLTYQRFAVGTLVGCLWVPYTSWQLVAFFVVPPVLFAVLAAVYAVITFIRFRQATKSSKSAISSNHTVNMRAQRTRRRLYLMVLSILTPYLPIVIALAAVNLMNIGPVMPFAYSTVHHHDSPYSWNSILLLTSDEAGFEVVNNAWISILTGIPIFLFFGMTKDAMNDYRKMLVFIGLGKLIPALLQEYDPDRCQYSGSSGNSASLSFTKSAGRATATTCSEDSIKSPRLPSHRVGPSPGFCLDLASSHGISRITNGVALEPQPVALPLPVSEPTAARTHRNPFLFRTTLDLPPVHFGLPRFLQFGHSQQEPAQPQPKLWDGGCASTTVQTRVWSQDATPKSMEVEEGVVVEMEVMRESCKAEGKE